MVIGIGICEGSLVALVCSGWSSYRARIASARRRREYEECVHVLRNTPLFQMQLPKADIPLLAAELKRHSYAPGALLAKQGEMQQDFFLVASGEASVVISGEQYAMLTKGDWWGDCSLIRKTPSMATVKVSSDEALVAFSLSKTKFESLGLHKRLRLPKRHAIACGRGRGPEQPDVEWWCADLEYNQQGELSAEDEEFIVNAITKDTALKEFHCRRGDLVRAIARKASIRKVQAGNVIVSSGAFSQEFYIVRTGKVEVLAPPTMPRGIKSYEALAALEKLHEDDEDDLTPGPVSFSSAGCVKPKKRGRGVIPGGTGLVGCHGDELLDSTEDDSLPLVSRPLRRARTCLAKPIAFLRKGTVFGEDVMFYNAQHAATFRACDNSDVELYVVARQDYMTLLHHGCDRYAEWCLLLDAASTLSVFFQSQRRELARHARGYQRFERGAMVIKQGRRKESPLLYVVAAGGGKAFVPTEGSDDLTEIPLHRGDVFGERSSSSSSSCPPLCDFSVQAGDKDHASLTCLCIDLSLVEGFGVSEADIDLVLSPGNLQNAVMEKHHSSRLLLMVRSDSEGFNPDDLEPVCALGSGGFGFVTLQRERKTKRLYALKRISKGIIPPAFYENICAERDLMELADSRFIIRYICSYRDASFLYMIMEAALGGDLNRLRPQLQDWGEAANATVMFYVACIIAGLEHLHDRHVVFRDLKPENALLDSRGYAKLCDMGMARFVFGKTYTFCGTPDYMAPEILRCSGHDFAVDWWALGIFVIDLISGAPPWSVEHDSSGAWVQALLTQQKRGVHPSYMPKSPGSLRRFLEELLMTEPAKRLGSGSLGAKQVRSHSWFTEANFGFEALHHQDRELLPPPFRPADFKPPCLPMPDFRLDIPIQLKEDRVVHGGRNVREERMELQEAVALLQSDDSIDGLYARTPQKPGESVFVFFVQRKRDSEIWLDERPMWVAYLKDRSLFKPYKEDPDRPDWDAPFAALPVTLCDT